jgi:hypothetical protein
VRNVEQRDEALTIARASRNGVLRIVTQPERMEATGYSHKLDLQRSAVVEQPGG